LATDTIVYWVGWGINSVNLVVANTPRFYRLLKLESGKMLGLEKES
jgi:hypothetical protein